MLVLTLDTTARIGSCALARDGRTLLEHAGDGTRSPGARLPADLIALLSEAGLSLTDVDVFAVATGPGSFTGLRVGIATMQGLSFAVGKPLIGISALDALAVAGGSGRVLAWMDAWRGEVYSACYRDGIQVDAPILAPPDSILAGIASGPITCIGDGANTYATLIARTLGENARIASPAAPPIAGIIASLATSQAQAGILPPPHAIQPLYVRRPDPEVSAGAAPKEPERL